MHRFGRVVRNSLDQWFSIDGRAQRIDYLHIELHRYRWFRLAERDCHGHTIDDWNGNTYLGPTYVEY